MKQSCQVTLAFYCIVAIFSLLVGGCAERREPVQEQRFSLTILLTEPITNGARASLPEDLIALALPLDTEKCSGMVFTPMVTLIRADLQPDVKMELVPSSEGVDALYEKVQHFFGSRTRKQIELRIERGLQGLRITDEMSTAPSKETIGDLQLDSGSLSTMQTLWVLGDQRPWWISSLIEVQMVADNDALKEGIANSLCDRQLEGESLPAYGFVYGRQIEGDRYDARHLKGSDYVDWLVGQVKDAAIYWKQAERHAMWGDCDATVLLYDHAARADPEVAARVARLYDEAGFQPLPCINQPNMIDAKEYYELANDGHVEGVQQRLNDIRATRLQGNFK